MFTFEKWGLSVTRAQKKIPETKVKGLNFLVFPCKKKSNLKSVFFFFFFSLFRFTNVRWMRFCSAVYIFREFVAYPFVHDTLLLFQCCVFFNRNWCTRNTNMKMNTIFSVDNSLFRSCFFFSPNIKNISKSVFALKFINHSLIRKTIFVSPYCCSQMVFCRCLTKKLLFYPFLFFFFFGLSNVLIVCLSIFEIKSIFRRIKFYNFTH